MYGSTYYSSIEIAVTGQLSQASLVASSYSAGTSPSLATDTPVSNENISGHIPSQSPQDIHVFPSTKCFHNSFSS